MATDLDRAEHILEAIDRINNFIEGVSEDAFLKDEKLMYACYANMIIIAEAASRITKETKKKIDKIEWQLITGFRNIIIHEYFRINWRLIWDVIENNLPVLRDEIQCLI
jgi:uncharacterized protein with HEPN domain